MYGDILDYPIDVKILENEDVQIEILDINDYRIRRAFELIGIDQFKKGNIKEVKGTSNNSIDNNATEKKIRFLIDKKKALKAIEEIGNIMSLMKDLYEASVFEFEIIEDKPFEGWVIENIIETIFMLEKSGSISYNIENEQVSTYIDGTEPRTEFIGDALSTLIDISNNSELSNIFARVGPPQDLTDKINSDEDARKAAKTFSEGRKSLEDLLYVAFTNKIKTFASCAGHIKNDEYSPMDKGYIAFNIDDEYTRNFIKYLNEKITGKEYETAIAQMFDSTVTESIYCSYYDADSIFTEIKEVMESYIKNQHIQTIDDNELNKQIDRVLDEKNSNQHLNKVKQSIENKLQKIIYNLQTTHMELKKDEYIFSSVTEKLNIDGLVFSIENTKIPLAINKIKSNMCQISSLAEDCYDIEELEETERLLQRIENMTECDAIVDNYISELEETLKNKFDKKVRELIRSSKLSRLEHEKEKLKTEKISFLGKILGKSRLKQVKLDNIDLKMKLIRQRVEEKEDSEISFENSLADLYAYVRYELGVVQSKEIEKFIGIVNSEPLFIQVLDKEKIDKLLEQKLKNMSSGEALLVPADDKKKMSNRYIADMLQLQNNQMARKLQNSRAKTVVKQNNSIKFSAGTNSALNELQNILDEISSMTEREK